jgi:hypothetical protein
MDVGHHGSVMIILVRYQINENDVLLNNITRFKVPSKRAEEPKFVVQPLFSHFLFQLRSKMSDLLLLFRPGHGRHMAATGVSSLEKWA